MALRTPLREQIPGVTRTSLWMAWKQVRVQLHKTTYRDVVDYVDFDIDPEIWIRRLIGRLNTGAYEPARPTRFTLAKGHGLARTMTSPDIPDATLYRVVANKIYNRAKNLEAKHVYFDRAVRSKAQQQAAQEARNNIEGWRSYIPSGRRRFLAWLHYDEYRRQLILSKDYPFIVTTDITNFFDTVLHRQITNILHSFSVPSRLVGLLFFLLERLSPREAYSDSPRIGLPVDEFDCSPRIAHIVLFPHDQRMCEIVGEEAYIRWMDDQIFGVESKSKALRLIQEINQSLAKMHLTPNAAKTRILTLSEARRHFHLDLNAWITRNEEMYRSGKLSLAKFRRELQVFWRKARIYEGQGEFNKVLSRLYRLFGATGLRGFRRRAKKDLLRYPTMSTRIFEYLRCTGSPKDFIRFVYDVWDDDEIIDSDVILSCSEALLRVEPDEDTMKEFRTIGRKLINYSIRDRRFHVCGVVGCMLILKFADRRSIRILLSMMKDQFGRHADETVRAAAIVYSSYGKRWFEEVRDLAATGVRRPLARVVGLVERMAKYEEVPKRLMRRLVLSYDPVTGHRYLDIRRLLIARLLLKHYDSDTVRKQIRDRVRSWEGKGLREYDRAMWLRLRN